MIGEAERIFEESWKPIVSGPDGSLDVNRVKKELSDSYTLMGNASRAYDHVTGGRISKTSTDPEAVISGCDAVTMEAAEDALADAGYNRPVPVSSTPARPR